MANKTQLRLLMFAMAFGNMGFMAFNAIIAPLAREFKLAEWHVGVVMMVSGLCWMLSSRRWGIRSDQRGRKSVLLEAASAYIVVFFLLTAVVFGRLLSEWSFFWTLASLLVLRSMLSATFGGMMPVSQAYAADCTTEAERPAGMAMIGFGQAIGMVLGPGAAALIAGHSLINPFFFGTACALLAWGCLRILPVSPRDLAIQADRPVAAAQRDAPEAPALRIGDPRLRLAVSAAFAAMLCVMSAQIATGFFVQDQFKLSTHDAASTSGKLLVMVGLGLTFAQMLVRKLGWAPIKLIRVGAVIAMVGFSQTWLVGNSQLYLAALYLTSGFGMGLVWPGFQAAASLAVSPHEQGAAGGAVTFAQAWGMVLAPMIATSLYPLSRFAPYALSVTVLAVVVVATFTWLKPAPSAASTGA